jgi:hypothetical protein
LKTILKHQNLVLWGIIILALFFRTYKLTAYFGFAHEQDLQAFIVKDILVNHHPRLIGQETSISGWFIGPLYYYLIAAFIWLFGMDPIGSLFPITMIAIATVVSVYWVMKNLYGPRAGYIASFIYAVSMNIAALDRWAVPTQPSLLWAIWFFWVLVNYLQGNFRVTPVLIILLGLIWHIHIAFIPLLVLIPIAIILSRKKFKFLINRELIISLFVFVILMTPFILFETRHGFSQIKSLTGLTHEDRQIAILTGAYKMEIILENTGRVLTESFLYKLPENNFKIAKIMWGNFVFAGIWAFIFIKKIINRREALIILAWIGVVIASLFAIQKALSEYYFNNLFVISIICVSLILNYWYEKNKSLVYILLIIFLGINIYYLFSWPVPKTEYLQKKAAIHAISLHSKQYNYQCIGINYIGGLGSEYGYRYFAWKEGLKLVRPSDRVPVYSIVNPYTISEREIDERQDDIGVIFPKKDDFNWSVCSDPTQQLLPLNGYVD